MPAVERPNRQRLPPRRNADASRPQGGCPAGTSNSGHAMSGPDLLTALGLVLVIEGLLYAVFPEQMKRLVVAVLELPPGALRTGGLMAATVGVAVIWLVHG